MNRNQQIIRTSIIGIIANIGLAAFKAVVGIIANSVSIIMDAVNNLSDAMSSVITIVGTKLSERPADRKHPFGYGRIEYFSAIVISIIVLVAGATSLIESVKKIFHPLQPSYTNFTFAVIITAIFVKLILGYYVKKKGLRLKSDSLIASGSDATFDAVVTLSTLVSAAIMLLLHVNLDGIFGTLISLVIIKAGIEMLASPVNELLGKGITKDLLHAIMQDVMNNPQVNGVFDMILNSYGPNTMIGSLRVNVLDTMTARQIHGLTRQIEQQIFDKYGIIMTIGIYAINTQEKLGRLQQEVMAFIYQHEHVTQIHAFYYYDDRHLITLDIIPDDDIHDDNAFRDHLHNDLKEQFPEYEFDLVIDHNYVE